MKRNLFVIVAVFILCALAFAAPALASDGATLGDRILTMVEPLVAILVSLVGAWLGRKFVKTKHDQYRMELFDKVADDALALIRLNNPGLKLVDNIQHYEDQLFAALMADPRVTYQPDILKRVSAATVARTAVAETGTFPQRAVGQ